MKTTLLLIALLPLSGFSQTKTTVQDGDFFNPLIWDCTCLPMNGDNLIINHNVTLNIDVAYNNGSITINSNGSLVDDGNDRAFWVDGTGTLDNAGTFTTHLILTSPDAELTNTGVMTGIDSMLTQGITENTGLIEVFDFLNDEDAFFENLGDVVIGNNFNNQGEFYTGAGNSMEVANDFSNCNLQTLNAWFENDGIVCIGNDFTNCDDDTLTGSGHLYIGNNGSNLGVFSGDFTFYTSGGIFGNLGTIEPTVTQTTGTCTLSLDDADATTVSAFPNPTNDILQLSITSENYIIYNLAGKNVKSGVVNDYKIDLSDLQEGWYLINLGETGNLRILKTQ